MKNLVLIGLILSIVGLHSCEKYKYSKGVPTIYETVSSLEMYSQTCVLKNGKTIIHLDHSGDDNDLVWSTGYTGNDFVAVEEGEYTVSIGGSVVHTVIVWECSPSVPNVITPNGDGYNDYFQIAKSHYVKVDLEVFNTDGALVFKDDDYQDDWNGSGSTETGFYYSINFVTHDNVFVEHISGYLKVIRK